MSYVAGRAEALPLRGRSCGCAWLSTVVHHIADLPACARELRRVLGDGAAVLVRSAFPGHHDRITLFRYFPDARRVAESFPSVERITRVFGAAGFAVECLDDVPQESAPSLRVFFERVRDHRHAATPRPVIDCLTLLVLGAVTGSWGGGFSDLVRVPFADAMLVPLPEGVSRHPWRRRATT